MGFISRKCGSVVLQISPFKSMYGKLAIPPLSHFSPSNRYFPYTLIYAYKQDLAFFIRFLTGAPNVCEAKCSGEAEIPTISTSLIPIRGRGGIGDVRVRRDPRGPSRRFFFDEKNFFLREKRALLERSE